MENQDQNETTGQRKWFYINPGSGRGGTRRTIRHSSRKYNKKYSTRKSKKARQSKKHIHRKRSIKRKH